MLLVDPRRKVRQMTPEETELWINLLVAEVHRLRSCLLLIQEAEDERDAVIMRARHALYANAPLKEKIKEVLNILGRDED